MDKNNINLPDKNNTCAIITVYQPIEGILAQIKKIKHQVHHIIVINNGCNQKILNNLVNNLPDSESHQIINNPHNVGLAQALNQGVESAYSENMDWAILLDQDTCVDDDILNGLHEAISSMPDLPAILGSNYITYHNPSGIFQCRNKDILYQKKLTVITSGSLLNLEYSRNIGTFKSEYFIDSIDHEYCLRANTLGYKIYITCKPLMTHNIGLQRETFLNYLQCFLSHPHNPERKYYVIRNSIVTAKNYIGNFPLWSIKQFFKVLAELLSILLFEQEKKTRFNYACRGIADGIASNINSGPLETSHADK